MTDVKVSQLPAAPNVVGTDLVVILYNANSNTSVANGSPSLRTIDYQTLCSKLVISNNIPSNSTSNGITGNIVFDSNFVYCCVANNTWKRSSLSSW